MWSPQTGSILGKYATYVLRYPRTQLYRIFINVIDTLGVCNPLSFLDRKIGIGFSKGLLRTDVEDKNLMKEICIKSD